MTLEELGVKLPEVEDVRRRAQAELAALGEGEKRVAELERDREALLRDWSVRVPEALESYRGRSATVSTGCCAWRCRP